MSEVICGAIHKATKERCTHREGHNGSHFASQPWPEGGEWFFSDAEAKRILPLTYAGEVIGEATVDLADGSVTATLTTVPEGLGFEIPWGAYSIDRGDPS